MGNFYSNCSAGRLSLDSLLFCVKKQGDVVVPYLEKSLHVLNIFFNKEVFILVSPFFFEESAFKLRLYFCSHDMLAPYDPIDYCFIRF